MDRTSNVLGCDGTENLDRARFGIDLNVVKLRRKARRLSARVHGGFSHDRATGHCALGGDRREGERIKIANAHVADLCATVFPDDVLDVDIPHQRGAVAQIDDDLLACLDHGKTGRVGHARTAGDMVVPDRCRVGDR